MIGFNIYDDYYDDGHVPKGEIQETWGRIESGTDEGEGAIHAIFAYLSLLHLPGVNMFLEYDDYYGDQIVFQHLTHAMREQLLEWLEKSDLHYKDQKIDFYSES